MKVSLKWLQTYFDAPLPSAEEIADAYTFHAFEIEEANGDLLDVKVLPNRAADCLSHRGLAKELSAILDMPLTSDPLRTPVEIGGLRNPLIRVEIEDPKKCARYMGALVKGVKVGPSPSWLKEALEAVGQRSINNIVDATNYVMLDIGQPLHAFDANKLQQKNGTYVVGVRGAKVDERITTLSGESFELTPAVTLITDANTDSAIALAGIKGGIVAELTETTTALIVESANFDGTTTRRASQTLKLMTDASIRFQNRPSSELAAYGMRDVLALITRVAGGEVIGVVDKYPARSEQRTAINVSLEKINSVLGSDFSKTEVENVLKRLGLSTVCESQTFTITPPFERTDLVIPEDLIEEVGRVIGYDSVPATELPAVPGAPDQAHYRGIEHIKDQLVEQGFVEVSTQSFAKSGDVMLANPLDKRKPALRTSLDENMKEAMKRAKHLAPLVLPPNVKPKLFEIGTVFSKSGERLEIQTSEPAVNLRAMQDDVDYEPARYELGAYRPYSLYPFVVRDIAFWAPRSAEVTDKEIEDRTMSIIHEHAGALLTRFDLFDRFEKEGRVSLAFRLVFQSFEKTLTDEEVNGIMEKVAAALRAAGYEVR